MATTLNIDWYGNPLVVTGIHRPFEPSRNDLPPEQASFEIKEAVYKNTNVLDLIESMNEGQKLEELCLEKL